MTSFTDLSAAEQAKAMVPAQVYPVLSIGKDSESGELQFSGRWTGYFCDQDRTHHFPTIMVFA